MQLRKEQNKNVVHRILSHNTALRLNIPQRLQLRLRYTSKLKQRNKIKVGKGSDPVVSSTPRAQDGCTFDPELQSSQSIEGYSPWVAHTSYEVRPAELKCWPPSFLAAWPEKAA